MEDDNINDIANSIVQQLKDTTSYANAIVSSSNVENKEELEKFILQQSSALITQSMEVVSNLKDYVQAGAAADEVSAFAEVVKASSGALEALNKIYITHEKAKTATNLKQMEIDAKVSIANQDNMTKLVIGREELMKQLIEDSKKVIDITPE
jgi:hypothetical protein